MGVCMHACVGVCVRACILVCVYVCIDYYDNVLLAWE